MINEAIFIATEQRFGNDHIVGRVTFADEALNDIIARSEHIANTLSEVRNKEPIVFAVMCGNEIKHQSQPIQA